MSLAHADRLVFEQTFDGLFNRGLGPRVTAALRTKLAAIGLDLNEPLSPAYPISVWEDATRVTAAELFPDQPVERGHWLLGQQMVEGYVHTVIGRALFGMLSVLGPRRTLGRVGRSFRSGNNYAESTVKELAGDRYEVWTNEVGMLRYMMQGALHASLERLGAKDVVVDVLAAETTGTVYAVSWRSS